MSSGVPLGAADSAWWRMEEPVNQMTITAVLTFDRRIPFERLEEMVRGRLLPVEPFRRRMAEPWLGIGRPRWVDDPEFALERHLLRASLPPPADDAALQELVSGMMSEPLDPRHPLWTFTYVDNHARGSALVARIHHCVADGIALIHLLLTLDDVPGNETPAHIWALNSSGAPPERRLRAGLAARAAASLGRLVLLPPDPAGALRAALGTRKRAAWSEPFPLAELRGASRRMGVSINDLLGAATAGALHRHLLDRGEDVRGLRLRAVVPVNLRRPHEIHAMGNRFGLVFLDLPVGTADAGERLARVHREMTRLKASCEAGVIYALLQTFGPIGKAAVKLAVWFLGRKASLVFTDVPGPREAVTFCGAGLTGIMAWVPQAGRLTVGVSVLSYAGSVQVGIAADAGVVPDPGALVREFQASLRELTGGPEPETESAPETEAEPAPQEA